MKESKLVRNLLNISWGGFVIFFGEALRQKTDYEFTSSFIQAYGTFEILKSLWDLKKEYLSRCKY